jgi:hypothetical protein
MTDHVLIPRTHLVSAFALIPAAIRQTVAAQILLGSEFDFESHGSSSESDWNDAEPSSYPLTARQLRELKSKLDAKTFTVIRTVAEDVTDGVGRIAWSEVKRLTGVPNWTTFAKGRLGGLHRALRGVEGVTGKAVLFWWNDDEWEEDGQGDWETGFLYIDGPALQSLRSVIGTADA